MTARLKFIILSAIFIGGFASLAAELVVMRQLSSFVGSTAVTASIIIGVIMAFMSWGYYNGSVTPIRKVNIRRTTVITFLSLGVLVIIAASFVLISLYFYLMEKIGIHSAVSRTFVYCLIMLSLPSFLFGRITSLLSRYLHKYNRNYTGKVMAVDTIGSVLGSILSTLLLMPLIGVNYTVVAVVALCLAGALLFSRRFLNWYWAVLVLAGAVMLNRSSLLNELYNIVEDNAVSTISIIEADEGRSKIMIQNDTFASKISSDDELMFNYIRYIEDNFLRTMPHDRPRDILVLGAGGFTLGRKDEYHNYTYVDIDAALQKFAENDFLGKPLGKNKKFIVNDANQFLNETAEKYDLIVLDTYSSLAFPPLDLVTREYFSRVKNHVKEGGIVAANIIASPDFKDDFTLNLDNTLRSVFNGSLQRQIFGSFNPWNDKPQLSNILYAWYNRPNPRQIYTVNHNRMYLDK